MSLAFTKPESSAVPYAKILLLGEAAAGKTHAALTFPRPAVIDAEGSIDWFADRFDFVAVPTKSFQDVRELIRQVKANPSGIETLVIDSLTTIYNGLVNAATEKRAQAGSEDLRPLDWSRIKRNFSSLIDELYYQVPTHVICIGWIKPTYAKPGSKVGNKVVKDSDMIVIGEQFDGDKKTDHAFDFIFKVEGNDGLRTRATVIKSRSGALKQGQLIEDFSWATLRSLFAANSRRRGGMTDEQQIARDQQLFDPVNRTPLLKELFEKVYPQGDLAEWIEREIAPDIKTRQRRILANSEFETAFELLNAIIEERGLAVPVAAKESGVQSAPPAAQAAPVSAQQRPQKTEEQKLTEAHAALVQLMADKQIPPAYVEYEWLEMVGNGQGDAFPNWQSGTYAMLRAFYVRLMKWEPKPTTEQLDAFLNEHAEPRKAAAPSGPVSDRSEDCPACSAPPKARHAIDCELGCEDAHHKEAA